MYIVFSAFRQPAQISINEYRTDVANEQEVLQRIEGYRMACEKYRDEIAAIQKYMPGWLPSFTR
ncbi:hypothetical protein [Mucilaginibacter rubeus]|uniref:Uncharacterized protein n=1 Tax=Mucilaginibacter rubeus TaxID=2027860 RepID=A0A5C1HUD9_9SPHI|nr:hypothetical protein [Mucilaginibacter rubeus]QEM09295.1 hypothetical protein DEO27_004455 [Mucilaginibacter rubeus]